MSEKYIEVNIPESVDHQLSTVKINISVENRKVLRDLAREALQAYSDFDSWYVVDEDGDLYEVYEPQGNNELRLHAGNHCLAAFGSFYKAHGEGAERDIDGNVYPTQRAYLKELLGEENYMLMFPKKAKTSI